MNLKKIWSNRREILSGIFSFIIRTPKTEYIAYKRMSICKQCSYYDVTGTGCEVPGTQPCCDNRQPDGCGCSLKIKTRSLCSECPIGKWGAEK